MNQTVGPEPSATSAPVRWAVVGGGFLGMTLALRLAQRGHDVVLYERAPVLGGLASTWQLGPVHWDRHYHVTLLSDSWLRRLLEELDLEQDLQWVETRTGVYSQGALHSVSNTVEFLRFPALPLIDKLRLGGTIFLASKLRDWRRLEDQDVSAWLTRWSGKRTFERFWLPLLRAKLGDNYRQTSAAFIWAVIQRLYAARRSGLKTERFGYVRGGYARVLERFSEVLTQQVDIRLGASVSSVEHGGEGVRVVLGDGTDEVFDQVVITAPAPVVPRLVPELTPQEQASHASIEYQGIVCASLLLRRPLAGFYLTNITDDDLPFTGVVEMSALVDPEQFGGHTLIYLPRYVVAGDPFMQLEDAEVERRFVDGLRRMFPEVSVEDVLAFRISRVPYVLPIPTLGYSRRVPPMTTSVPGLHVVNSAQIVNGTLNVNETVQLAERAVEVIDGPRTMGRLPLRSEVIS
jgi:protoporphyrinogen oxidase